MVLLIGQVSDTGKRVWLVLGDCVILVSCDWLYLIFLLTVSARTVSQFPDLTGVFSGLVAKLLG